jgi:hypothetical protein
MGSMNTDTRRGLRSIVQAIVALAFIGLLYWLTYLLSGNAASLREIARGSLVICAIGTIFYGAENVSRAVRIKTIFGEAEVGGDDRTQM